MGNIIKIDIKFLVLVDACGSVRDCKLSSWTNGERATRTGLCRTVSTSSFAGLVQMGENSTLYEKTCSAVYDTASCARGVGQRSRYDRIELGQSHIMKFMIVDLKRQTICTRRAVAVAHPVRQLRSIGQTLSVALTKIPARRFWDQKYCARH